MEPGQDTIISAEKLSFWKRLKRRRWWISAGVVVLLIAGFAFGNQNPDVEYVTAQVQRGTLVQTVEASGELASLTEVDLSFERSGTIAGLSVNIGDEVEEGSLLVMMASADVLAELSRAQESVNLAQANINARLAGSTNEEIAVAQTAYDSAKVEYDNAVRSGEISVASAVLSLQEAQDTLSHVREDNGEDITQTYEDLRSVLRKNVIEIRSTLADADDILGRENKSINNAFESELSASDPQMLNTANRAYDAAARARNAVEVRVYTLSSASSFDELSAVGLEVQDALELTAEALYDTRRVLDATFSNSVDLSSTELGTFKTTIDTARNTIQTEEASLSAQLQLITTTQIASDVSEQDALYAYESALQAHTKAQADRDASIASAMAVLTSRSADVATVVAEVRSVDVAPLYAQLGQALADLDSASAQLSKTELRSPISGTVTELSFEVGELATAGTTVVTIQNAQLDAYKVTVQIAESDVAKVEVHQPAEMTFDAFGDDVVVLGNIMRIDPAEQSFEGVVFYEVDVALNEGVAGMKPGMSVDVTIQTDEVQNVLFVPQRAVLERDGSPYVRILTEDGYEERPVEKGLRADGGSIEILSGVQEGEDVILSIRE